MALQGARIYTLAGTGTSHKTSLALTHLRGEAVQVPVLGELTVSLRGVTVTGSNGVAENTFTRHTCTQRSAVKGTGHYTSVHACVRWRLRVATAS